MIAKTWSGNEALALPSRERTYVAMYLMVDSVILFHVITLYVPTSVR